MTEEHKAKVAAMLMDDYDIRPSLAYLIVKVFVESTERIIHEDAIESGAINEIGGH